MAYCVCENHCGVVSTGRKYPCYKCGGRMVNMINNNPPDLNVEVSEEITVDEQLSRHSLWFNGMKFFHTVKLLPPHK